MGIIVEPEGVEFTVINRPLTQQERRETSELIAQSKQNPDHEIAVRRALDTLARYRQRQLVENRERIEAQALLLPLADRASLAHRLIDSLTETVAIPSTEPEIAAVTKPTEVTVPATKKRGTSRKTSRATRH